MINPVVTKVEITAEFIVTDGDFVEPGRFGPVIMTPRQWSEFDLQKTIEKELNIVDESSDT